MIARAWRGVTRAADAERYLEYLAETGFPGYRKAAGNQGVLALRRITEDRAEFLLLSFWDSEASIRGFAGPEPERAVFYPEDAQFLVERGERVDHYTVEFRAEGPAS